MWKNGGVDNGVEKMVMKMELWWLYQDGGKKRLSMAMEVENLGVETRGRRRILFQYFF